MADHKLAIAGTGVLVDKLVVASRHVLCARLDDKHVDAHSELGEHGDERTIDLAGRHWNVRPQLQIRCCLDDLVQVDISGKREQCLVVDDQSCDKRVNAFNNNVVGVLDEGTNVVGTRKCRS